MATPGASTMTLVQSLPPGLVTMRLAAVAAVLDSEMLAVVRAVISAMKIYSKAGAVTSLRTQTRYQRF